MIVPDDSRKVLLANVAAAVSSLSAGASIAATRFVIDQTDPVTIGFYRYLIGAFVLLPVLAWGLATRRVSARDMLVIALLGVVFFGYFPWAFSASLKYTTAARGAVGLATAPIMTLVLAQILGRERMTPMKSLAVAVAFAGVAVAFSDALLGGENKGFLGEALMLAAVLGAAVYSVYARPYLVRHGPVFVTSLAITFGMLSLLPFAAAEGALSAVPTFTTGGWVAVLFLGIVGGAVQFVLYTWALRRISPTRTAIYVTLNPISALVLAAVILGESLTPQLLAGAILVISGIFLANRPSARRAEEGA